MTCSAHLLDGVKMLVGELPPKRDPIHPTPRSRDLPQPAIKPTRPMRSAFSAVKGNFAVRLRCGALIYLKEVLARSKTVREATARYHQDCRTCRHERSFPCAD